MFHTIWWAYYRSVIDKGASKDCSVPTKILDGGSAWHFQTDKQNGLGSATVHAVQPANITIWSYQFHCTWVPQATQTCPANSDFRSTLINFHAGFYFMKFPTESKNGLGRIEHTHYPQWSTQPTAAET